MEEIRKNFELKDKYPLFAEFDRCVLQPAVKEINEMTELRIEISPKKTARAVTSLDIKIESNLSIIYIMSNKTI